jgi:hypothetical protein
MGLRLRDHTRKEESMKLFRDWLTHARLGRIRDALGGRSRTTSRRAGRPLRYRPRLEGLESRDLLSTFGVVLATDNGGAAGQEVTATTGDLRYCIEKADAAHSATADAIIFNATLFATPQTITLNSANGPLVVNDSHPLTINAPSSDTATVSGGDAVLVFDITSGTVTISNLAISHGNNSAGFGGGINNSGALTLTKCILDHDAANAAGGLYSSGTATVTGCTFNDDSAAEAGAILATGTFTLTNSNVSNDGGTGCSLGGGLFLGSGTITVTNCILSNDTCSDDGGGVFFEQGGVINAATFTKCTLSNDSAGNGGGGLCTDGDVTVTMKTCTLSNDGATQGGGITLNGGVALLTGCTIANCSASGILNEGTLTMTGCTLNNNSCVNGGALFDNQAPATLTNCTFSNNVSTGNSLGGGAIYNYGSASTLTVTNCTLAYNSALNGFGGGIANVNGGILDLTNTIVAENTASDGGPDISGTISTADHNLIGDSGGSTITTDQGGNLIGGNGNPVIDPRLGPLQNNGGPTETLALHRDSLAIGHADDSLAPATDQRGHARTDHFGLATDIGAYEYP